MHSNYSSPVILTAVSWLIVSGVATAAPHEEARAQTLPTALGYTSVFAHYKGYSDQAVQSWRDANERVGQIGGWRAYARETAAQPSSSTSPAANPRLGHHEETRK